MLTIAIDLAIIITVVFCCWRGYNNGLIRGVFGVATIIVSLFVASVAASAYSGEFAEMISPFIGGVVDSALLEVVVGDDDAGDDMSEHTDKSQNFIYAYSVLRKIGLPESPAVRVAEMATSSRENEEIPEVLLSDYIADKLSSVLAYVAVFGIAFALLAIIFAVLGNLINFVFSLPGLEFIDSLAGALFGLAKGLLIIFLLATIVRYVGLLAPDILNSTRVLKYIVNNNPIAYVIGI